MRIRTVKPEFFSHEELFELEVETSLPIRVCFIGLWCAADREGRFRWQPRRLKSQIAPYDEIDFSRVLDALATRGFICRYACPTGEYGWIPTFSKHQVINNRERASDLPDPYSHKDSDAWGTREARVGHAGKGEGKGREGNMEGEGNMERSVNAPAHRIPEPTGPDYANPEFFDNLQGKVRGLSREWSKPFMRSEMEELAANAEFFASVSEPEWIDLRFFMSAKTIPPELDAKAYWRPNSRLIFIRNAADMAAKAANFRRECRKAGYEVPEHPKDQP